MLVHVLSYHEMITNKINDDYIHNMQKIPDLYIFVEILHASLTLKTNHQQNIYDVLIVSNSFKTYTLSCLCFKQLLNALGRPNLI